MKRISLVVIILIASFFRLYQLTSLPISMFNDEIDVGYQAWSLFQTGRDYSGNLLPTYIKSLVEWRAPLLMYVTAPFVGILGPTTLAVRLPVAIMGILNIYLIYLVSRQLFPKSSSIPLIAALLLTISPWHLHYSRAAFEVTLLTTLILLGILFYLKDKLIVSVISFGFSFYAYSTANIFVPIFVLSLCLIYRGSHSLSSYIKPSIIGLVVIFPLILSIFSGSATARFLGISIFSDQKTVDKIVLSRIEPWIKLPKVEQLFNNKITAFSSVLISNYLQAFSTQFLFVSGDPLYRHSPNNSGELLVSTLPFLLFGLVSILHNLQTKTNKLLIAWLLLSPIPSSLTQDGGMHATRLFLMLPPLIIITAHGLSTVFVWFKSRKYRQLFLLIFFTIFFLEFSRYWYNYSTHYRYLSYRYWQYGYEKIMQDLNQVLVNGHKIYLNNNYEPVLNKFAFYSQYSPRLFQQGKLEPYYSELFSGYQFTQQIFIGQINDYNQLTKLLEPGDVYLAVQGKEVPGDWDWAKTPPSGLKITAQTKDVYDNPLFYLVTLDNK